MYYFYWVTFFVTLTQLSKLYHRKKWKFILFEKNKKWKSMQFFIVSFVKITSTFHMNLRHHDYVYKTFNFFVKEIKFVSKGNETHLFDYQIIDVNNNFIFNNLFHIWINNIEQTIDLINFFKDSLVFNKLNKCLVNLLLPFS